MKSGAIVALILCGISAHGLDVSIQQIIDDRIRQQQATHSSVAPTVTSSDLENRLNSTVDKLERLKSKFKELAEKNLKSRIERERTWQEMKENMRLTPYKNKFWLAKIHERLMNLCCEVRGSEFPHSSP